MAKHTPTRCCMGCNKRGEKNYFLRLVRNEGKILLDNLHKMGGRGAYICKDHACLKQVQKSRRFNRVFKCQIPQEIYAQLESEIGNE